MSQDNTHNHRRVGVSTISALSIGIGGMVGGGIFAVTGLTVELTRGATPIAFVIAGILALLTSYSYLKLTLKYPQRGRNGRIPEQRIWLWNSYRIGKYTSLP